MWGVTLDDILNKKKEWIELTPHKDGLPGRGYISTFDKSKLGKPDGATDQINDVIKSSPDLRHGDPHYDVIEKNPMTGNIYHNRIYKPKD